jgi:hypothetical protein|tara:strand:+ start:906 stop:1133 length:228 start_codon:yes stop_codon:yes gene_type:complete
MGIWQNNQKIDRDRRELDSKRTSLKKTASWRLVAILNSYWILLMHWTEEPLWNALWMNLTGAILYYIHERLWNKR